MLRKDFDPHKAVDNLIDATLPTGWLDKAFARLDGSHAEKCQTFANPMKGRFC